VERFRRAEWKAKAEEALTRLGAPIPVSAASEEVASAAAVTAFQSPAETEEATQASDEQASASAAELPSKVTPAGERHKRRRRGRRGGRRHRHGARAPAQGAAVKPVAAPPEVSHVERKPARVIEKVAPPAPEPARSLETSAAPASWLVRGRTGEPALASRLALLESQLRRLIASSMHRVDEAEQAPAGPGVFLLSDSDQTTYYFAQACETLRIGVGNLLRTGRASRRGEAEFLRARFAEHLGISESRVSKYLKEHCAVRWLQLDEGATELAHFAIAILRPGLNG
jgi:hypothetical protein